MKNKLLIICGPTATGKTALGIEMAKKFNGDIISADSRQVYRGMDIGTGKDLEKDSKYAVVSNRLGFYEIGGVRIFGYDLVDPTEEFSISQYLVFAEKAKKEILDSNKTPIIVGGTGFYIKALTDGVSTIDVPRNEELRTQLNNKSVAVLYESLSVIDPIKAASMNSSDNKNPRRLIRAIEIAQYTIDHPVKLDKSKIEIKNDILFIGLKAPKEIVGEYIEKRIDKRVTDGIKEEIQKLLSSGVGWHNQSMYSLGYRQYRDYFEGDVDEKNVIEEWLKEERKYAARQMVWFKKENRINWFDVTEPGYQKKVENMIEKWHNETDV